MSDIAYTIDVQRGVGGVVYHIHGKYPEDCTRRYSLWKAQNCILMGTISKVSMRRISDGAAVDCDKQGKPMKTFPQEAVASK